MFRYPQKGVLGLILVLLLAVGGIADAGQVWLNTSSGVYHCPGGQWYGNTKRGKYLEEEDAVSRGYRPSYNKACDPGAYASGQQAISNALSSKTSGGDAESGVRVWVNTKSHVYHCPGTRYYGNTKRGRYMSELEALSSGNRGAYGKGCF